MFIPKDLGFLPTAAILAFGWLGLRWLRDQQREGYKHESFRQAVTSIFLDTVQSDAYRERTNRAVGEAVSSSFAPVTTALREHSDKIEKLSEKVAVVEGKVEGILGRMQTQRKGDIVSERPE